jgi:hypothetical protein
MRGYTKLDDRDITVYISGATHISFSTTSRSVLGSIQSVIQYLPGSLSLVVKQSGYSADHTSS